MRFKKCAYCLKRITGKPYKKGKKFFCSSKCKEEYYLNDTKTLTKELDKAMSQLVRSKGVCEASDVSSCGGELQDAHFISRSNLSLRWDIMNHLSLCYKHHFFFAHRNPFEFVLWFEKKFPERYNYLRFARTQSKKWTPEEMRETLKNIKNSNLKALVRFYGEYIYEKTHKYTT